MRKLIFYLLVIAIILSIVNSFCVYIVDMGKLEKLHEDHPIHTSELYYYYSGETECQMPDCNRTATTIISHQVSAQFKRFEKFPIENDANFSIESGTCEKKETDTAIHKEKYLVLEELYDGSYKASIKEKKYTYEVAGDTWTHHYTSASGVYCDSHVTEASNMMVSAFETSIKSSFAYRWGVSFFPWSILILIWLAAIVCCLGDPLKSWHDQQAEMEGCLKRVLPTFLVTIVLYLLCTTIKNEDFRIVAAFTMLFAVAIMGCIFFGWLIRSLAFAVTHKKDAVEATE